MPAGAAGGGAGGTPYRIMLVDDSAVIRGLYTKVISADPEIEIVASVGDGEMALRALQRNDVEVAVLDIEMPRMDGFEVATLVRHDERLKDLPIIMITSRTGEKHRDRALAIGVNEYLGKPYQESVLLESIQRLVHVND